MGLYRGKRLDNGEWAEGGYFKHCNRTPAPIGDSIKDSDIVHLIIQSGFSDWNMPRPINAIPVDAGTVGQFTGLLDRNGKRAFEGDIVKHSDEYRTVYGVIRFGQYLPHIDDGEETAFGFYIDWISDGANDWNAWWRNDILYWLPICEACGTEADNPELLTGGQINE